LKGAAILEAQFKKHPDHPGVAHYLIHSYDFPEIAAQGLPAALCYSDIASGASHALHMPSHIFTRVGAWQESVTTNTRSIASATPPRRETITAGSSLWPIPRALARNSRPLANTSRRNSTGSSPRLSPSRIEATEA
jgi:hypothetical protein